MTGRDDRRGSERKPSRLRVWADPGGVAPATDCQIVDISASGALIAPVRATKLPNTFSLQHDGTTKFGDAEVVWRANGVVGVKFSAAKGQ
jgi:hypothetical protein